MLNVKKLQAIRDNILGVTVDYSKYGDLNSVVYLQQILDAVNGVTSTPARVRGNLNEKIYLQKIRNAKRGVADGQFGSLSNSIYLQQIINAFNGAVDTKYGDLGENSLLDFWYSVAGGSVVIPWYLAGGVVSAQCLQALQSIGAASLAASLVNLITPGTHNAAVVGTPDPGWNAADGWIFDVTRTHWLVTDIIAGLGYSVLTRFSNFALGTDYLFGAYNNATVTIIGMSPNVSGQKSFWNGRNPAGNLSIAGSLVAGVLAVAGPNCYINGVPVGVLTNAFVPTVVMWIGGLNKDGVLANAMAGNIQAHAVYNSTLTDAQIAAISTAMAALP